MGRKDVRWALSPNEKTAARRFIKALRERFPELANGVEYGRGHEGTVYVYCHLPQDDEKDIEIHEVMSEVSTDLLVETGVSVLLMRETLRG